MTANVSKIAKQNVFTPRPRPVVVRFNDFKPVSKDDRIAQLLTLSKAQLIDMYLKENQKSTDAHYYIYRTGTFMQFPDFIDTMKSEGGNPWMQDY